LCHENDNIVAKSGYKRVVKGGIDHVSRKIKQPFHNSRKIQHWHLTLHGK